MMQKIKNTGEIFTVSQINTLIKVTLEDNLPSQLVIKGEITNFKHHPSGHCYFSLKDEKSNLPCVMWKTNVRRVRFRPENGLAVLATGFIDVYVPHGRYQLIVDELIPAGVGALQLAYEQMVKKLRAEGFFDDEHKKALPAYPQKIGILTSESGAAVHDIIDSIHNRWPCVELLFYPVPVQGEGAAEKIATALKFLNKRNKELKLDVLIVGRGGGSMEDLWAFNEEVLARAIFDSNIPIISAVGHEVDVTVADFVADARASTPTKAGIVAVPDMQEVLGRLINIERRLTGQIEAKLKCAQQDLEIILANAVFRNPLLLVQNAQQQLDELSAELAEMMKELLTGMHRKFSAAYEQIVRIEPHRLLKNKAVELNNCRHRINVGIRSIINNRQVELNYSQYRVDKRIYAIINNCQILLTAQENRLEGLNPKSVLKRGYSITTNKKSGLLVKTRDDVRLGEHLITELTDENLIESKVTKK
ncbi:MAG: exodeoxyribonuclease VII large subunit [Planctomycetes bacterium]|nr:exodeoxyribonuclease VII large subunit [Planctomycetota bacterium]